MIGRKVPLSRVFLFAEWTKYIKNQFVYQNNSFDSKINIKAHNYLLQFVIKVQHFIDTNTIKYFYLNLKFIFECFLEDAFSEPARMFINSDKKSWNEAENLFSGYKRLYSWSFFSFRAANNGTIIKLTVQRFWIKFVTIEHFSYRILRSVICVLVQWCNAIQTVPCRFSWLEFWCTEKGRFSCEPFFSCSFNFKLNMWSTAC